MKVLLLEGYVLHSFLKDLPQLHDFQIALLSWSSTFAITCIAVRHTRDGVNGSVQILQRKSNKLLLTIFLQRVETACRTQIFLSASGFEYHHPSKACLNGVSSLQQVGNICFLKYGIILDEMPANIDPQLFCGIVTFRGSS